VPITDIEHAVAVGIVVQDVLRHASASIGIVSGRLQLVLVDHRSDERMHLPSRAQLMHPLHCRQLGQVASTNVRLGGEQVTS
jgi:hypothetical protein